MLANINRFLAFLNVRSRPLFNLLIRGESTSIIGLMLSVLLFSWTQSFQKDHDFYQSILKEQIDSDAKLLESVGVIISRDKNDPKSKELLEQFMANYYGRTLLFETCFYQKAKRVELLRDLKETIEEYYTTDVNTKEDKDKIKLQTIALAKEFSKSYKIKEGKNECF